ncbi:MAG TPA: TerB family tellurite resistance protein [Myxococcota bacterium]|nr:TerB family tellurite resistance protein [Myxococcota bacterium]
MSTSPPLPLSALEPHVRQLAAMAELMLGIAHADGAVSWAERATIASVLASFLDDRKLPPEVEERVKSFDPNDFDLAATCGFLNLSTSDDRVALLDMVSRVADADTMLGEHEQRYLRKVAAAIGATEDELAPFLAADDAE